LARAGKLPNMTGLGSPYEAPEAPEICLDGGGQEPADLAQQVLDLLRLKAII
jgi:bifunctional enzyme CysN/CysC